MRHQQFAARRAFAPVDGLRVVVARVAHRGDAHRQFLQPRVVRRHVHVAIPQAREQRLATAVDDLRARGNLRFLRREHRGDEPLVDDDRLIAEEHLRVRVEHAHVGEGHGAGGRFHQRLRQGRRLRRHRLRLRFGHAHVLGGVLLRQPAQEEHEAEELALGVRPDRNRRSC